MNAVLPPVQFTEERGLDWRGAVVGLLPAGAAGEISAGYAGCDYPAPQSRIWPRYILSLNLPTRTPPGSGRAEQK